MPLFFGTNFVVIFTMEKPQKKTYSDVQSAFESHEILQSSKSDLEQFLLAIAMTRVLDSANQIRTTEMGDTIRLLLAARQSQQMHSQSSKVSCICPDNFRCGSYLFWNTSLLCESWLRRRTKSREHHRDRSRSQLQQLKYFICPPVHPLAPSRHKPCAALR